MFTKNISYIHACVVKPCYGPARQHCPSLSHLDQQRYSTAPVSLTAAFPKRETKRQCCTSLAHCSTWQRLRYGTAPFPLTATFPTTETERQICTSPNATFAPTVTDRRCCIVISPLDEQRWCSTAPVRSSTVSLCYCVLNVQHGEPQRDSTVSPCYGVFTLGLCRMVNHKGVALYLCSL